MHGSAATYAETVSNVRILRTKEGGIGGSLYGWPGTSATEWRELAAIKGGKGR